MTITRRWMKPPDTGRRMKPLDQQTLSIERDVRFLLDPQEWPRWPMCPVKRRNGTNISDDFYCGVVMSWDVARKNSAAPVRVYKLNTFAVGEKEPRPKTWREVLEGVEFLEYADVRALAREWRVD